MNRLFLLFISFITIGFGAYAMEKLSLINAAQAGNLEAVQQCIAQGENINQSGGFGHTPLIWAAHNNHLSIVDCLIDAGAAIDQPGDFDDTALIRAASNGYLSVVEHLVKAGANIDKPGNDGDTALIAAAYCGWLSVVEHLIKAGANIDATDQSGDTALVWAAIGNELACCQVLVHAMLKPSLEQKNRIYEFLLCMKSNKNETIAAGYTFCILDVFKRHLRALIKEENKPKAIVEIEKIPNQILIKNQLLALCESQELK